MLSGIPEFLISLSIVLMSLAFMALGFLPFIIRNRTIAQAGKDSGGQNDEVNRKEYIQKVMYPDEDVYVEYRGGDVFYVRNQKGEYLVTLSVLDNGSYDERVRPIK